MVIGRTKVAALISEMPARSVNITAFVRILDQVVRRSSGWKGNLFGCGDGSRNKKVLLSSKSAWILIVLIVFVGVKAGEVVVVERRACARGTF